MENWQFTKNATRKENNFININKKININKPSPKNSVALVKNENKNAFAFDPVHKRNLNQNFYFGEY